MTNDYSVKIDTGDGEWGSYFTPRPELEAFAYAFEMYGDPQANGNYFVASDVKPVYDFCFSYDGEAYKLSGSRLRSILRFDKAEEMQKAKDAWNGSDDWCSFRDGWMACAKSRAEQLK